MSKPTPEPYRIQETINGFEVVINESHDRVIARFPRGDAGEGKANARAWVDGMAAMEKLARVREILERAPMGETLRKLREEVISALGEAKP